MDITILRSLATLLAFVVFIGIIWWAFSRRNKSGFDEAAGLPFAHDDAAPPQHHTTKEIK